MDYAMCAQSFFRVGEWDPGAGYEPCVPTRLPEQLRAEMGQTATILYRDAEQTLWDMQIGHFGRFAAVLPAPLKLLSPQICSARHWTPLSFQKKKKMRSCKLFHLALPCI